MTLATVANLRLKSAHTRPPGLPKPRGSKVRAEVAQLRVGVLQAPVAGEYVRLLSTEARLPHEQAVLPVQFFTNPAWSGAKQLMAAILQDAVLVYRRERIVTRGNQTSQHYRARHVREAREWLRSEETEWPYSFLNICAALGLDAGRVRDQVFEGEKYGRTIQS